MFCVGLAGHTKVVSHRIALKMQGETLDGPKTTINQKMLQVSSHVQNVKCCSNKSEKNARKEN